MAESTRKAVQLLRGVEDRVSRLKESVRSTNVLPNIVKSIDEGGQADDSVSLSTGSAGSATYDTDSYDNSKYQ